MHSGRAETDAVFGVGAGPVGRHCLGRAAQPPRGAWGRVMKINRRRLLGAAGAGALLHATSGATGGAPSASADEGGEAPPRAPVSTTICPFCAVGCGLVVTSATRDGKRVLERAEGDPDHPINEGTLCPKGASLVGVVHAEARLTRVLHRAPGASRFVERDWDFAAREIARRIKAARDATFEEKNAKGETVRRTLAIASVGSAALDNEECWQYQAFLRSLGVVWIEHQARI